MSIKRVITGYVDYNYWAHETLTEWLKTLDREILYAQAQSSFASIDLTMQHMIHSQNFWMAVLTGRDYMNLDERVRVNEVDWTISELMACSKKMIEAYGAFSEEELLREVHSPDSIQCRYEFIMHSVNHGSYHRGQIVTMARSFGINTSIPTTDYDAYLWTKVNAG